MKFDKRIHPIKKGLASTDYYGLIKNCKFVRGKIYTVYSTYSPIYSEKKLKNLTTQLLFGEYFRVFDINDGVAWGQCMRDNYVGYTPMQNLKKRKIISNYKVHSLRTFIYRSPSIKSDPLNYLSFNSLVLVSKKKNGFSFIPNLGWCISKDLVNIKNCKFNLYDISLQYLHTPYLWGGRDSMGLDCSGLVQNLYQMIGIELPRDTDLQAEYFSNHISESQLKLGDLIFWKGHVALALDNKNIIHANAHHMKTQIETLKTAKTRISKIYGKILKICRVE